MSTGLRAEMGSSASYEPGTGRQGRSRLWGRLPGRGGRAARVPFGKNLDPPLPSHGGKSGTQAADEEDKGPLRGPSWRVGSPLSSHPCSAPAGAWWPAPGCVVPWQEVPVAPAAPTLSLRQEWAADRSGPSKLRLLWVQMG